MMNDDDELVGCSGFLGYLHSFNVRPSVHLSSTKSFSDFNKIWRVGTGR